MSTNNKFTIGSKKVECSTLTCHVLGKALEGHQKHHYQLSEFGADTLLFTECLLKHRKHELNDQCMETI